MDQTGTIRGFGLRGEATPYATPHTTPRTQTPRTGTGEGTPPPTGPTAFAPGGPGVVMVPAGMAGRALSPAQQAALQGLRAGLNHARELREGCEAACQDLQEQLAQVQLRERHATRVVRTLATCVALSTLMAASGFLALELQAETGVSDALVIGGSAATLASLLALLCAASTRDRVARGRSALEDQLATARGQRDVAEAAERQRTAALDAWLGQFLADPYPAPTAPMLLPGEVPGQ